MASTMLEFEKLNNLYTAIKDIDKIIESNSNDKLDNILTVLKNIDKKEFDKNIIEDILLDYRRAIMKIYSDSFNELNKNIKLSLVKKDEEDYLDDVDDSYDDDYYYDGEGK